MASSMAVACYIIVLGISVVGLKGAEAQRAFFVFGDSIVDNGNNNFLATEARADSPPYGIDYPTRKPTGRFSNGYHIPDFISQALGAESTLPYLDPELKGEKLLVGANFASAGVGILNDSGIEFVNIIRTYKQLQYWEEYQQRVNALIGPEQTKTLINEALVLINLGSNDFVNNYYLVPHSPRSRQYNLPDFVKFIISEYKKVLRRLYELGARRVLVAGIGALGCVPGVLITRSTNGECSAEVQRVPTLFNPQLVQIIKELNSEIGSHVFIAVETQQMQMDFIINPQRYGFITSKTACCGEGRFNGIQLCTVTSNLCPNRDLYAFWDAFHPSERACRLIVQQMTSGTQEYMYPMNLSTILALDSKKN
ncbi:unnamed protein product [Sphenostylis stenocarpa]|uniref:Uncharacterized protein n=1 Tax=Sphenostylis stenocarpa TaxID=92480 RepID=A0AA86SQR6_9FABA|nr:unnamed protein product [Sphenostylis stenocarpa]